LLWNWYISTATLWRFGVMPAAQTKKARTAARARASTKVLVTGKHEADAEASQLAVICGAAWDVELFSVVPAEAEPAT